MNILTSNAHFRQQVIKRSYKNHAKEMLESNLFSVTEAALSSGFSDISHFNRVFKKVTQYSSTEYKRIIQN